jgi:hypothetical protein
MPQPKSGHVSDGDSTGFDPQKHMSTTALTALSQLSCKVAGGDGQTSSSPNIRLLLQLVSRIGAKAK